MSKAKLAILGLGSRSTLFYLKELNVLYKSKKGAYSTCPFLLLNADFNDINPLLPHPSAELDSITQSYLTEIEKLDTEFLLIPNITLHETVDRLSIKNTVLHPLHLTLSKIKKSKLVKIVLFGSLHTMKSSYIRSYFNTNGIEVILPSEEDMRLIDEVRKQVCNESEGKELIKRYHSLIAIYSEKTAVVLACTELSILNPKGNDQLFDMAQIQMEEAIKLFA